MTMLNFSGSILLLDVMVKGCHCTLEILGTFTNAVLLGAYLNPGTMVEYQSHMNRVAQEIYL